MSRPFAPRSRAGAFQSRHTTGRPLRTPNTNAFNHDEQDGWDESNPGHIIKKCPIFIDSEGLMISSTQTVAHRRGVRSLFVVDMEGVNRDVKDTGHKGVIGISKVRCGGPFLFAVSKPAETVFLEPVSISRPGIDPEDAPTTRHSKRVESPYFYVVQGEDVEDAVGRFNRGDVKDEVPDDEAKSESLRVKKFKDFIAFLQIGNHGDYVVHGSGVDRVSATTEKEFERVKRDFPTFFQRDFSRGIKNPLIDVAYVFDPRGTRYIVSLYKDRLSVDHENGSEDFPFDDEFEGVCLCCNLNMVHVGTRLKGVVSFRINQKLPSHQEIFVEDTFPVSSQSNNDASDSRGDQEEEDASFGGFPRSPTPEKVSLLVSVIGRGDNMPVFGGVERMPGFINRGVLGERLTLVRGICYRVTTDSLYVNGEMGQSMIRVVFKCGTRPL